MRALSINRCFKLRQLRFKYTFAYHVTQSRFLINSFKMRYKRITMFLNTVSDLKKTRDMLIVFASYFPCNEIELASAE